MKSCDVWEGMTVNIETTVIATLDKNAKDTWAATLEHYGWTIDYGEQERYIRWGAKVFPYDRIVEEYVDCLNEGKHGYPVLLERGGKQFYVMGGKALPSYEQVKLLEITQDEKQYAFAGWRQGEWVVCFNGEEIVTGYDILKIAVSQTGNRFAFHVVKNGKHFIAEPGKSGPLFDNICWRDRIFFMGRARRSYVKMIFSKGGQFLAYEGLKDGSRVMMLEHEPILSRPGKDFEISWEFSEDGSRWSCFVGEKSQGEKFFDDELDLFVDGAYQGKSSRQGFSYNSNIFSPDATSVAYPVLVSPDEYALFHDGELYELRSPYIELVGWLPGNIPAWVGFDGEGHRFYCGPKGDPLNFRDIFTQEALLGPDGSYVYKAIPLLQELEYPKMIVKNGRILRQADIFMLGGISDFGLSSKGQLAYKFTNVDQNDINQNEYHVAIDDNIIDIIKDAYEFWWANDGIRYCCGCTINDKLAILADGQYFGPFDDYTHAEFSNDSQHWIGVVTKDGQEIVLLDGEEIDRLDKFIFPTPDELFSPDSQFCHYHGVAGGQLVRRQIRVG